MDFIPGFVQGITRVTISYPFDVVKTNMQKNKYSSTYDAFKNILKNDPKLLYRGSHFCYMTVPFDRSLQYYAAEKYNNKVNPYLLSACVGFFVSFYNIPVNYLTTNIAILDKSKYNGSIDFIKKSKFKDFYKGYTIEMPRSIVQSSLYMGTYFYLRNNYNKDNNLYYTPIIGAISSSLGWMVMFPVDTLKTDRQTTSSISTMSLIKHRYKNHGFRNFYKGITPVLVRAVPSASIGMLMYELTKKHVQKYK